MVFIFNRLEEPDLRFLPGLHNPIYFPMPWVAKMMANKRMQKDEHAVSPVIAVIMVIALTVMIAAVATAFASEIIHGLKKTPNAALAVEGAYKGSKSMTIIHHGRDTIVHAFSGTTDGQLGTANWSALEVRINGAVFAEADPANATTRLNGATGFGTAGFEVGDELKLDLSDSAQGALRAGDSISVVYTPTGDTLQRVTVT
jgi:FlaG/FlaF family flagellin (archaellin)